MDSCRRHGVEAASEAVRQIFGPASIAKRVVDIINQYADEPTSCQERLIATLKDRLEETMLFREQVYMAYRTLARHGTVEVHDDLDDARVSLPEDMAEGTKFIGRTFPASDHEQGHT